MRDHQLWTQRTNGRSVYNDWFSREGMSSRYTVIHIARVSYRTRVVYHRRSRKQAWRKCVCSGLTLAKSSIDPATLQLTDRIVDRDGFLLREKFARAENASIIAWFLSLACGAQPARLLLQHPVCVLRKKVSRWNLRSAKTGCETVFVSRRARVHKKKKKQKKYFIILC